MTNSYFGSGDGASTLDYFKYKDLQLSPEFKPTPGAFTSGEFSWDKAGKFGGTAENLTKNPFGGGNVGNRIDAFGKATSWLGQSRKKAERDEFMSKMPYALGSGSQGFGGQVLDNLGVVMPNQHAPIVIPGTQQGGGGRDGLFGEIGGLAGAIGTAAGVFGPLGMPIGAGVGGLIDRFV